MTSHAVLEGLGRGTGVSGADVLPGRRWPGKPLTAPGQVILAQAPAGAMPGALGLLPGMSFGMTNLIGTSSAWTGCQMACRRTNDERVVVEQRAGHRIVMPRNIGLNGVRGPRQSRLAQALK